MIDAALFDHLTDDATVSGLIGTRAYPQRAPADAAYPLVTFMQVAAGVEETRSVNGPVSHFRTLQQVEIYARRRTEALSLATAVRGALDGITNQTWAGVTIKAVIFDQQLDGNFESDANLHRIIQQYRISYSE